MNLIEIQVEANKKMKQHGLTDQGWVFELDNSKRRMGVCKYTKKVIGLSKNLCVHATDEKVVDTILHEIAHALVGDGHGHDRVWVRKALEIGCRAERCYSAETAFTEEGREAVLLQAKYTMTCPSCGGSHAKHRKSKRNTACGKCCIKYNNGRYTSEFNFVTTQNY